jgi:dTDP-4-amino-4,6-dideoxygalactose transaminase
LAPVPAHARHAHHLYTVLVSPEVNLHRDDLALELRARNIGTSVHFRAIHLHSWYRDRYGLRPEDLPVAADWSERAISLPLFPAMAGADVEYVAAGLGCHRSPERQVLLVGTALQVVPERVQRHGRPRSCRCGRLIRSR